MYIGADVTLADVCWRPRVEANAEPHRPRFKRRGDRLCSGERLRRGGKGEEERIALRVHFDTAPSKTHLAYDVSVLEERLPVRIRAKLVQNLRRALHIREEESDSAGWKLGSHDGIIRRSRSPDKALGGGRPAGILGRTRERSQLSPTGRPPACKFGPAPIKRGQDTSPRDGCAVRDSAVCPVWATMVSVI